MDRVALIDGTGLVYRAWHALPTTLKTTAGQPTNAAYGFAQMFRKLLTGKRPRYGAVVFDAGGRTFRDDTHPQYKAHRPYMEEDLRSQLPLIDALVVAHRFPILRVPGVEADDVIGTLTLRALAAGLEVVIVSGDKDFAQLVGPHVRLLDSTREVTYDAELVYKRWGVPPERFVDWLALVGDRADNIPGVPGIGQRGAAELLGAHGTLEGVLAADEGVPDRQRTALRRFADQARISRDLATIRTTVPLPLDLDDLGLIPPDSTTLNQAYRDLEFFSLLSAEADVEQDRVRGTWFVCDTLEQAAAAMRAECCSGTPVATYPLHEYPGPREGALVGIALSPRPDFALYLPFAGPGATLGVAGIQLLAPWLEDARFPKLCHEARSAIVALAGVGVALDGVVGDTALASYLIDPTLHLPHRLEQVVREYLHRGMQPVRTLVGGGRALKRFAELTVDRAGAWACHNADAIGALWPVLEPMLAEREQREHHDTLDLPLAWVLAELQLTGLRVDPERLERLAEHFRQLKATEEAAIERLAGHPVNPGSLKQLQTVLFDELGLPVLKRTKTGYSTASDVLTKLAPHHAIVGHVLRWRQLAKMVHGYTDVLLAARDPHTGRVHATFQQTVSASGRLITTEPDLQRTPVRTEEYRMVREAVRAAEGTVLVSADWSQIELRLLAHTSRDPMLMDAFHRGVDVHAQTAARLFDISPTAVSPTQRNVGKTINFATFYGQGPSALADQLDVSDREARRYINAFFATYSGVTRWRDKVVAEAYARGYVTTLLGRRRYLPELAANNPTDRAYGERIAVNTPIQGSGADLCKLAMLRLADALAERGLRARMVLQVHDEIVFECVPADVDALTALAREVMEHVAELAVPLVVDVGVGESWATAH
ncbi:MAG: DNA polymerase-1 [Myxococcota bacterium]|jgi:DNA polymerase-1